MTRPSLISRSRVASGPREAILRGKSVHSRRPRVGKSVGSFVPKLAKKAFEKYGFSTMALLTDWSAIVGQDLAQCTKPEKLKWPRKVSIRDDVEAGCEGRPGATLILRVEPARALDVEYSAQRIVERINGYFGYRAVQELRLQQVPMDVGQRRVGAPSGATANRSSAVQRDASSPANGTGNRIQAVADEKLRSSLEKLQAGILGVSAGS